MHGQSVRQLIAGKLRHLELVDDAGRQIGVEQSAVNARRLAANCQIAEHVLTEQLGNAGAAIHETASNGNAIAVVVLQVTLRTLDRVDHVRWNARAVIANSSGGGHATRASEAVELEGPLLDRPAIVAAGYNTIDFLDRA